MAALLGLPFTGVRRGHGAPGKHEHALLAADATPNPAEHWVLEDSSREARYCSAGRRGAAEDECLAAVREAASRDGLEVTGLKVVNDGEAGIVPAGCSYSLHTIKAMFNTNAAGRYLASKAPAPAQPEPTNYRLACLALPDEVPSTESTRSEAGTSSPPEKRSTVLFLHVHNNDEVSSSQHQQIVDSWAYKQGLQVRFIAPESCVPPKKAEGLKESVSLRTGGLRRAEADKTSEEDLPTEAMLDTLRATPQFEQVSRPDGLACADGRYREYWEAPTLLRLHKHCTANPDDFVAYGHTKTDDKARTQYTDFLLAEGTNRRCMDAMNNGSAACGVNPYTPTHGPCAQNTLGGK